VYPDGDGLGCQQSLRVAEADGLSADGRRSSSPSSSSAEGEGGVSDGVGGGGAGGRAVLVERRVQRYFDSRGRCWRRVVTVRAVDPAAYDALHPSSASGPARHGLADAYGGCGCGKFDCDCGSSRIRGSGGSSSGGGWSGIGSCNLRDTLSDEPGGAALLAAASRRSTPFAHLRACAPGRAQLNQLAVAVRRRFASSMRAARAAADRNPAIAAWAAGLRARPWPSPAG
jgi:hypothetical protein